MKHIRRLVSRTEMIQMPGAATAPATTLNPTFTGSTFASNHYLGEHLSTDWEIATDSNFSNIVQSSYNDTINKVSFLSNKLAASSVYYVRYRYHSTFKVSGWSSILTYVSMADNGYISTPTVSVDVPDWTSTRFIVNGSAFLPVNLSGVLEQAEIQISTEPNFTLIHTSGFSNTTSKEFNPGLMFIYLYARIRYISNGKISGWSSGVEFFVGGYQW